jgi:hypothetical protein
MNVESFDTIYYAVLQVIVTASANGVCMLPNVLDDADLFSGSGLP